MSSAVLIGKHLQYTPTPETTPSRIGVSSDAQQNHNGFHPNIVITSNQPHQYIQEKLKSAAALTQPRQSGLHAQPILPPMLSPQDPLPVPPDNHFTTLKAPAFFHSAETTAVNSLQEQEEHRQEMFQQGVSTSAVHARASYFLPITLHTQESTPFGGIDITDPRYDTHSPNANTSSTAFTPGMLTLPDLTLTKTPQPANDGGSLQQQLQQLQQDHQLLQQHQQLYQQQQQLQQHQLQLLPYYSSFAYQTPVADKVSQLVSNSQQPENSFVDDSIIRTLPHKANVNSNASIYTPNPTYDALNTIPPNDGLINSMVHQNTYAIIHAETKADTMTDESPHIHNIGPNFNQAAYRKYTMGCYEGTQQQQQQLYSDGEDDDHDRVQKFSESLNAKAPFKNQQSNNAHLPTHFSNGSAEGGQTFPAQQLALLNNATNTFVPQYGLPQHQQPQLQQPHQLQQLNGPSHSPSTNHYCLPFTGATSSLLCRLPNQQPLSCNGMAPPFLTNTMSTAAPLNHSITSPGYPLAQTTNSNYSEAYLPSSHVSPLPTQGHVLHMHYLQQSATSSSQEQPQQSNFPNP